MQLTAGSRRPPHAMKLEIADISQKPFMQVRANRFLKKKQLEKCLVVMKQIKTAAY
jgi:hypothetical protein